MAAQESGGNNISKGLVMIWDYFQSDDPVTRSDMERIGALIYSDIFLMGLGAHAKANPVPSGFPIVTDIVQVDEYIVPKLLWDQPEPLPYCELHYVIGEEMGILKFGSGMPEERQSEIHKSIVNYRSRFDNHLFDFILLKYVQNDIENHLRSFGSGAELDEKAFKHIALHMLQNSIFSSISSLIDAAYFGGLKSSPVFERVLQGFETGGMPCGWLGPEPKDGGDPAAAVALLHLGRQSE